MQAALEAAGIEPCLENARPRARCGALFFDAPSPGLCAEISEASRLGQDCLLAVSLGSTPLSDAENWRLLEAGAADAFAWTDGAQIASKIEARFERWEAIEELTRSPIVSENLVGENTAWRSVLRDVVEVARFTDSFVLITGESGTGKEGVARLIHALDPRPRKGELFVVDCAAVVPSLSGSEFFGHEKGAFTGAVAAREGAFAMADGGTLFLDEVGELPPAAAGRASSRDPGGDVQARRKQRLAPDELPASLRDQPQPARSEHGGPFPEGPLSPHRGLDLPPAEPPQPCRRHSRSWPGIS